MHGLQAAVSKRSPQILSMWHWLLGQYRPSSPSAQRYDPVDHSAMPSRLATRIMSGHVTTDDCNHMATIISQGECGAANTCSPAPLVILSRYLFTYIGPYTSDNHVASVHSGWYTVGRGLAVRCRCVVDPYSMMCIVGWAGSSLVLMLFLSTACLAIQKEKWDVIVLNVNAHTRGAPFAHRCLEPMHPLTATKCPTLSATWVRLQHRRS